MVGFRLSTSPNKMIAESLVPVQPPQEVRLPSSHSTQHRLEDQQCFEQYRLLARRENSYAQSDLIGRKSFNLSDFKVQQFVDPHGHGYEVTTYDYAFTMLL